MKLLAVFLLFCLAVFGMGCRDKSGADPTPSLAEPSATAAALERNSPAVAPAAGVTHGTLRHDDAERTYRLFVPSGVAPGELMPLVVGLHGGLGWGDQFAANSRFEATAQAEGFIAVFPDGQNRTWNGGNCCGAAARNDVDDVGFLAELIDDLAGRLPIDRDRVFVTGHSNGGIMAFRFACERPALVKAIAPVAGSLEIKSCPAPAGTSLLAIHGDSDRSHPIEGGQGPRSIAGVDFVSMEDSMAMWTKAMGCEATPEHRTTGAITSTAWTQCKDGSRASYLVVAGADHPWPGGTGGVASGVDASTALDATAAIWAFFESLD